MTSTFLRRYFIEDRKLRQRTLVELVRSLENDRLVCVVGSMATESFGYGSWDDLKADYIRKAREVLDDPSGCGDHRRCAQAHAEGGVPLSGDAHSHRGIRTRSQIAARLRLRQSRRLVHHPAAASLLAAAGTVLPNPADPTTWLLRSSGELHLRPGGNVAARTRSIVVARVSSATVSLVAGLFPAMASRFPPVSHSPAM
jgi:hypothetical protein